jgi:hypothetical protein
MTPITDALAEALRGLSAWVRANVGPDDPNAPHDLLRAADEALAQKAAVTAVADRWYANRLKEDAGHVRR